jgi:hypothetical protein
MESLDLTRSHRDTKGTKNLQVAYLHGYRTIYPQITQIESLDLTRSHRDTKGAKKL